MLRTEYRIASEPSSSLMVPGASDGGFSQHSEIVYGKASSPSLSLSKSL